MLKSLIIVEYELGFSVFLNNYGENNDQYPAAIKTLNEVRRKMSQSAIKHDPPASFNAIRCIEIIAQEDNLTVNVNGWGDSGLCQDILDLMDGAVSFLTDVAEREASAPAEVPEAPYMLNKGDYILSKKGETSHDENDQLVSTGPNAVGCVDRVDLNAQGTPIYSVLFPNHVWVFLTNEDISKQDLYDYPATAPAD